METYGGSHGFRRRLRTQRWVSFAFKPLSTVLEWESRRASLSVRALRRRFPEASNRDLAQRLIDAKKRVAQNVGGALGVFGVFSLPADYLAMAWLELSLLCDLAVLYQWNVKSQRSKEELLDLLGYVEGIGALTRAGPALLSVVARRFFQKGVFRLFGRTLPMLAVPWGAYLNRSHVQKIGDQALRHFEGFQRAQQKPKQAAGA